MDCVIWRFVEIFGDIEECSSCEWEKVVIVVVLVDRNGCFVDDKGVVIFSFLWVLFVVLNGNFLCLGEWVNIEMVFVEKLIVKL